MAKYRTLNVSELADELENLREMKENGDEDFDQARFDVLEDLEGELGGDIEGNVLVAEDDFEEYAKEYFLNQQTVKLDDWPFNCIDWGDAADELKENYSEVEFEGCVYLYDN